MLRSFVSPSQYSAQLKIWGLRTYKTKAAVPTDSERRESNILLQRRTKTTPNTPAQQVRPEADHEPKTEPYLHDRTPTPKLAPSNPLSVFDSLGKNIFNDDQQQVAIGSIHPDSPLVKEASPISRDADDDVESERSPSPSRGSKSPQSPGKVYLCFTASETVQDAVDRVVQALSEVLADSELKELFDNLTDTELDELLINHAKLKEARNEALVKHTGQVVRWGANFWPRPTNLVEIRDALERRAMCLYSSTPQAASVDSDQSAKALTNSSLEQSPVTHYGDSTERAAVVQIYDEDTKMQQDLEVIEELDEVDDSKNSLNMSKNDPASCSACVAIPSVEYEVSFDSWRLWSEVNSRQDRLAALVEIRVLAGCFFAARLFADAFDLYYLIWVEPGPSPMTKFEAAINCARTSATSLQESCVEAMLHHLLSAYPKDPFLFRSPQDLLGESILHSFLGDLYEKLKKKTNAEAHAGKAIFHLDEHKISIIERSFSYCHHIIAALKSQIAKRQRNVSEAIGYNASTVSIDDVSKSFANQVQDHALLENLLSWCALAIHENARGLDAFRSVLPKNPVEQRGFICRTLLCFLIERWLSDQLRSTSAKDYVTLKAGLEAFLSVPEALSAIAMLVVHEYPDQNKPLPPLGRQPSSGTLSSAILKNIKGLMKFKSNHRTFSEVYLSLIAASGEVRGQPLNQQSRMMLCQFVTNIAATGLVYGNLPQRGVGSHSTLVPSPDLFREFEIRPASLSSRLYSPRSSFSSGLNSIRATATKTMMNSVLSLAKRQSGSSVTAMSTTSDRSSWSFGVVTGMPRALSALSDAEMMDHEDGTIQEPQDEKMSDF